MVHKIFLAEGYTDQFDKFEKFWHGKTYKNGKAKVRLREIKLYHFGINECGDEEFMKDIKDLCLNEQFDLKDGSWTGKKQSGMGIKNKMMKIFKWLRRFFPQIKQMEFKESSGLIEKERKKGNHFIMCLYPIGEVKDARYKDGSEVV